MGNRVRLPFRTKVDLEIRMRRLYKKSSYRSFNKFIENLLYEKVMDEEKHDKIMNGPDKEADWS